MGYGVKKEPTIQKSDDKLWSSKEKISKPSAPSRAKEEIPFGYGRKLKTESGPVPMFPEEHMSSERILSFDSIDPSTVFTGGRIAKARKQEINSGEHQVGNLSMNPKQMSRKMNRDWRKEDHKSWNADKAREWRRNVDRELFEEYMNVTQSIRKLRAEMNVPEKRPHE